MFDKQFKVAGERSVLLLITIDVISFVSFVKLEADVMMRVGKGRREGGKLLMKSHEGDERGGEGGQVESRSDDREKLAGDSMWLTHLEACRAESRSPLTLARPGSRSRASVFATRCAQNQAAIAPRRALPPIHRAHSYQQRFKFSNI
ncbi:hypothetical protein LSTR_LSTR015007 [Laodelphax striatellus]|uniref:Uncharacterized protein n=1 Tax=Laodelphax striatellus TaxID=195883 RepID=A0A482WMG4_LAOST|nr:hypothetical protein LSTR_LSTR007807 [Laodelphax striatellus]RZF42804.1 hypothetical protein LSTR_LSTR015007 [Laodelphax striatellus]